MSIKEISMSEKIVVDPVTRIEGHLRIEAVYDESAKKIKEAFSSGTMVRGLEVILKGRDPRDAWAFTQRICGVCTTVHAIASVRAVEDALSITIPKNANLIRNLMFAALYIQDHPLHFYHLHALDWVDIVSALNADPEKTSELARSVSDWHKSSPAYFRDVKQKLKDFAESGQLGIFDNGYWGHKLYKLPPEANLMAVAHYLEVLDWHKDILQIFTILGGRPTHPNYLVGGWPGYINPDGEGGLNIERLLSIQTILERGIEIIDRLYVPDLLAIASFYKDWASYGCGIKNFLCFGDLPANDIRDFKTLRIPRGAILNGDLKKVLDVDLKDPKQVQEFVSRSWYSYSEGDEKGKHPLDGETQFKYTGPKPPFSELDTGGKYSWLKSPRWKGNAMEVGPLARVLICYAKGTGEFRELVDMALKKLDIPVNALFSTLGRTAARGIETKVIASWARDYLNSLIANIKSGDTKLHNMEKWDQKTWPAQAKGAGFMEAPRGALSHFVKIADGKIENYQCVVPTTWNGSPRDSKNQPGPYEAALKDTPVEDRNKPLEILRTIHSFDPCIACAVHVLSKDREKMLELIVE
jgi:hydrogenase large subunit